MNIKLTRVINGVTYSTETAVLIGEASYGDGPRDFNFCAEGLYRTEKGALFIAGEGGAATGYARRVGPNETSPGAAIRIVTVEAAMQWCHENHHHAALVEHFGDHIIEG